VRSQAEFIAKMGVVLEEVDESEYWLDFVGELEFCNEPDVLRLRKEVNELAAMAFAARRTALKGRAK
jgi:four helix bundle protein